MKVKIYCHSCVGKGTVTETAYPNREQIEVTCPECNGDCYVWDETNITKEGD